jgi:beta-glucosidase
MNSPSFPDDFLFGVATAAYQVEGAANEDGRAPSIWDTFARQPGNILHDHNGDISVDQYHRYKEDVQLMKWIGVGAYRFSVSWPRVIPQGRGAVNSKGVDYYNRLIDELLAHGIQPWLTLFHWDLPQVLEDEYGGWRGARVADDFAEYAAVIADRFSDRVRHFFTINEFGCVIDKGYGWPRAFDCFPPGLTLPRKPFNQTRHNALLAHGKAVQALRAGAKGPIEIGVAENAMPCVPVIATEENITAARKAFREINANYLTAIMEGRYIDSYLEEQGADAPVFTDEEMKIIGSPLDFLGNNIYTSNLIRAADHARGYEIIPLTEAHPKFGMPWLKFTPQNLYWIPRFCKELWNVNKFYITENGCATDDLPTYTGEINDTERVVFLQESLTQAARAVAEGWPLKGYFLWSLLDNFEWAYGYTKRFGITYVNYSTLARTPKLSAHWYRELIRTRRIV